MGLVSLWSLSRVFQDNRVLRARFLMRVARAPRLLKPLLEASPGSSLHEIMSYRPRTAGAVLWPFQCSAWRARTRIDRIVGHFAAIDELGPPLRFHPDSKLVLLDLGATSEGVRVVLDQPKWLLREGHLALNIFVGDRRAFSLAFSFYRDGPTLEAFIGGLQGRSFPDALDLYRRLTKDFHGLRPRDLLIELFRMLCLLAGVHRIRAVANDYRFFRSPYFAGVLEAAAALDYDDIWKDRGAIRVDRTCFELPAVARRPIEEIAAKKRGMYRRRYAMLDKLQHDLSQNFPKTTPVFFEAT